MVTIKNFKFTPADLTVPVGTTVTWTNEDDATHTATSKGDVKFNSGDLATGKSFSFTFDKPGKVDYICTIHTYMKGTITVQ